MTDYLAFRKLRRSISTMAALAVAAAFAGYGAHNAAAVEMSPAAKAVVDYDKSGEKPKKKYRIAYLTECVDNPYCLARLAGLKAAAQKYGFEFKIFDANFSPATQAKVVENAVTEGFSRLSVRAGCGAARLWPLQSSAPSRPESRSSPSISPCAAIPITRPASQQR